MIPNYPGCENCPLKDCPPVMGYGKPGGLLILGEAPGKDEVLKGRPFVGKSGKLLQETLKVLGVNPQDVYMTNAVLCRPPTKDGKDTPPKPKAVAACNDRLMSEIREYVKPSKILILGGTGLQALTSPGKAAKISKWQGQGFNFTYGWETVIGEEDLVDVPLEAFTVATYHPAAVMRAPDLFRDYASDIFKVLNKSEPEPEPVVDVHICRDTVQALEQLEILMEATVTSCDLETTGFSSVQDTIMSIAFGALLEDGSGYSVVIPIEVAEKPKVKKAIKDFIKSDVHVMPFHNIKFDLQFLQVWLKEKVRPPHPKDTMLMQYAQDERGTGHAGSGRGYRSIGLKDQARIRYDIPDYTFDFKKFFKTPPEERDWDSMYTYQGMDVYTTCRLLEDLEQELEEESSKLPGLVENLLLPAALMFTEVEQTGIPIDIPYMQDLLEKKNKELETMEVSLKEMAKEVGVDPFNPGTHQQVKTVLKNMKFPVLSTGKTELSLLLDDPKLTATWPENVHTFVETIIDYRQASVVASTYIEGVLKRLDPDGRVRPDVIIPGADTGRLSYRDPNPQNQPLLMGPIIRDGYIAIPGYTLILADYSQLELRTAAWYSQDPFMIQIFKDGRDIHSEAAVKVFHKPPEQISKGERYAAKCMNFGVIYGRGAKSLIEGIEARILATEYNQVWTLQEAQDILNGVLAGFPKFRDWIKNQHEFVHKYKYVESATGRRRRFPLILSNFKGDVERRSVNTPIQGLASDINLDSAIQLHPILPKGADILFLVHDSIMVLCKNDLVDKVCRLMKRTMEKPRIIDPGDIPFKVDIEVGQRWGHMSKWEAN